MPDADGTRRYPLEPLARTLGIDIAIGRTGGNQPGQPAAGFVALAQALGISRQFANVLYHEGLNDRQADKYAIAIGHHPSHIWPNWWDIDELALEREARNPELPFDTDDNDIDDNGDTYGFAF